MTTPLRIALLGYRSHPHVGGQGIYLCYLSKALVDLGHKVDVISGPPYPDLDERVNLIQLPSLDLYAVENPTRALRFKHLLNWADFYEWWSKLTGAFGEPYCFGLRVEKYFKKNRPAYDIIHDNQSLCFGLLALQKLDCKVVATIHHPIQRDLELALASAKTDGEKWLLRRWYNFIVMQEKVVKQLHHLVTVSKQSQADIQDAFNIAAEKITVIPNGVDTEIFRPVATIARVPYRLITTASSDQPLKGLTILLQALAALRGEFPMLRLVVIGKLKADGATQQELEELQLASCVEFKHGISTQELVETYAGAQIAVVPSLYEGFGLPAAEAMACGIPLICSDGGALPEVVGDAALLVKAGDVSAMITALRQLLGDQHLREQLSRAGRERSVNYFSWRVVAETLSHYYRGIIGSEPSRVNR